MKQLHCDSALLVVHVVLSRSVGCVWQFVAHVFLRHVCVSVCRSAYLDRRTSSAKQGLLQLPAWLAEEAWEKHKKDKKHKKHKQHKLKLPKPLFLYGFGVLGLQKR